MAYRKNPSDNDQSWLESAANDSASRWHGFDNKNNGKDKFFKADILPNDPDVLIVEGAIASNGSRFLAGVYGETAKTVQELWTPAEITTEGWWDAADESTITESGGDVSQWDDKSGNDRHAAQGSGSQQPSYGVGTLNGLNLVTFDGVSNRKLEVGGPAMTARDYFMVFNSDAGATFINDDVILFSSSLGVSMKGGQTTSFMEANTPTFGGAYRLAQWYLDGSAGSLWRQDLAALVDFKTYSIDGQDVSFAATDWLIGGASSGIQSWCGNIAEMIVIATDTSTADRQKIEGYLSWKWGLQGSLPIDHPYKKYAGFV